MTIPTLAITISEKMRKDVKILIFFLFFLIRLQGYSQIRYDITGRLENVANGTMVYLLDRNEISFQKIIDSVPYMGQFNFKGSIKELSLGVVKVQNTKRWIPFIFENGKISIQEKNGEVIVVGGIQNRLFAREQKIGLDLDSKSQEFGKKNIKYQTQNDSVQANLYKDSSLKMQELFLNAKDSFYIRNGNAFVTLFALFGAKARLTPSHIDSIFSHLTPELKNHSLGRVLQKFIASGKIAKAFPLMQMDNTGKIKKINFPNTKYVLFDFWASWCAPCRENNPKLIQLNKEYGKKNLEIVSVSSDDNKANWLDAIRKDKMDWINVSDLRGWNNSYNIKNGIRSLPTYLLVDPSGKILFRSENGMDTLYTSIEKYLKK